MYPTDRKYTKEHEWVRVEDDEAVIGITDFAQQELGDIVFVELPESDRAVRAGDVLGTIESVKAVSEIYAPVTGTVSAGNDALDAAPETINSDPHGKGWYCRIRLADRSEVEALMEAAAYAELAGSS